MDNEEKETTDTPEQSVSPRKSTPVAKQIALVLGIILFLYLLLFAPSSNPILRTLGISNLRNDLRGLFLDCNKRENRGRGFCDPTANSPATRQWESIRKRGGAGSARGFNLT